jgi:5-methylcytosine-specific restriction endonuclease McrA
MSLYEIGQYNPNHERKLRDGAFQASLDDTGNYVCANCGLRGKSRVLFQVDHIKPMNKGGKSVPENLQILCRKCNAEKSDKE